jgi:hypothetical protein
MSGERNELNHAQQNYKKAFKKNHSAKAVFERNHRQDVM